MEFFRIRCHVEIQIAAEQFIGSLAAQDHLDAHSLDLAGHEVHGGGGANRRHVIGFDVFDHVIESIQSLLNGEYQRVVNRPNMFRHFLSGSNIGAAFQSNAKAVHLRPPGFCVVFIIDALLRKVFSYGGNDGRIQSAADEQSVGDIAHQVGFNGLLQRCP